jgi:DNA-binding protein YbaB
MTAGFAGGGGLLDPDDANAYLQDWKGRVDRMAASTQAMSDQLQSLQVTAEDGDGLAEVTVDSTGVLVDVRFSERIQRVAPEVVSRGVMTAVRNARQKAAERSRQIVTDTMGSDSVAARAIAERVEQQLLGSRPAAGSSEHDPGSSEHDPGSSGPASGSGWSRG